MLKQSIVTTPLPDIPYTIVHHTNFGYFRTLWAWMNIKVNQNEGKKKQNETKFEKNKFQKHTSASQYFQFSAQHPWSEGTSLEQNLGDSKQILTSTGPTVSKACTILCGLTESFRKNGHRISGFLEVLWPWMKVKPLKLISKCSKQQYLLSYQVWKKQLLKHLKVSQHYSLFVKSSEELLFLEYHLRKNESGMTKNQCIAAA